jgi:hypothetical protein
LGEEFFESFYACFMNDTSSFANQAIKFFRIVALKELELKSGNKGSLNVPP